MGSWLVVAEDGVGLRFAPVPSTHACHDSPAPASGVLSLPLHFRALAAWGRTVYAAPSTGGLLEIDARDPALAIVTRALPCDGEVVALAATASRLYALTDRGLVLLDLGRDGFSRRELHPEIKGTSIQVAGRTLTVAGGPEGDVTYRDISPAPQVFEVSVTDNSFTPSVLSVAIGDTVRWSNVSGSLHNVVSCSPGQIGCEGATAAESFTSGPATGFWSLDHTFTQAGDNPYVCQPHAFFMVGSVTVTGSTGTPPGVPDGRAGAPMLVGKLAPGGSTLSIAWDATSCSGATGHQIVYGYAFGLPGSTGGAYELAGAACSIGTASPYNWAGVPSAFVGSAGFVYWLVVATDGAATEGSWGKDGAGIERAGPGNAGSSAECGIAFKSLTNACPP